MKHEHDKGVDVDCHPLPSPLSSSRDALCGTVLDGRYVLHRVIRSGGFGTVWRGEHMRTGTPVAVKVAPKREGVSVLLHEARIMMHIEKHERTYRASSPDTRSPDTRSCMRQPLASLLTPKVRGYGSLPNGDNYIVMDLLGDCLSHRNVMRAFERRSGAHARPIVASAEEENDPALSVFLSDICTQIHDIIAGVHAAGFVYRDVKPSNFLFAREPELGTNERTEHRGNIGTRPLVYAVDFGLAMVREKAATADASTSHIEDSAVGTLHYMSIRAHERRPQTPRDDLESLAYLFFYIPERHLPWAELHDNDAIMEAKRAFRASAALDARPNVKMYMERVDALGASEAPNYGALRSILSYIVIF